MKLGPKHLVASLLGAVALFATGCSVLDSGLTEKPELLQKFNETETRARLGTLNVAMVELSCSPLSKKVVGEFTFHYLDGRPAVEITGDTPCERMGKLVAWSGPELRARDNYTVALLTAEVDKLVTKANMTPPTGTRDNSELAAELMRKYGTALDPNWRLLSFKCDKDGGSYKYLEYNEKLEKSRRTLDATCARAHQNFSINVVRLSGSDGQPKSVLLVRQFNDAPPAALHAAFAELLADRLPATKF